MQRATFTRTATRTRCTIALTSVALHAALALPSSAHAQSNRSAAELIAALRTGGLVLACRHAITDHRQDENERTLVYDDASTQRQLNEEGEQQAHDMGAAFRRLGITVSEVIASPMTRARRTAELMFGTATLDSLWHTRGDNHSPKRAARLAALARPVATGNRAIVSHIGTLNSVIRRRGSLEEGDCYVIRPRGDSHDFVGRLLWRELLSTAL